MLRRIDGLLPLRSLQHRSFDLLEASTALVNYHDTDGTSPVSLLAREHGAKVHKNLESPKSPGKIPCLSGFQVGHTLGNVKTAEVRKKFRSYVKNVVSRLET